MTFVPPTPGELAIANVRADLHPVRVALGETTDAAETYTAKHGGAMEAHIVPMLWRARSENA